MSGVDAPTVLCTGGLAGLTSKVVTALWLSVVVTWTVFVLTPAGLAEVRGYADGIGPWKPYIRSSACIKVQAGACMDANGDGKVNDADRAERLLKSKAISEEEADSRNKSKLEAEAALLDAEDLLVLCLGLEEVDLVRGERLRPVLAGQDEVQVLGLVGVSSSVESLEPRVADRPRGKAG